MRGIAIALTVILFVSLGCGSTEGPGSDSRSLVDASVTPDGLVKAPGDAGSGSLFIREAHGIGGYDAVIVAPSWIYYIRGSDRLDPEDEQVYLASLEQALVDAAEAANVPMEYLPGACVLKIGIGLVNVELAKSDSADVIGDMMLVMEIQDSQSRQALMRYLAPKRIEREAEGGSREEQVRKSFDKMIEEVDIIVALRGATLVPSGPRPGCKGVLLDAGQVAVPDEPTS
jgi:hypothetical protein